MDIVEDMSTKLRTVVYYISLQERQQEYGEELAAFTEEVCDEALMHELQMYSK